MPLPSVVFSGITIGNNFGSRGTTTIRDTSSPVTGPLSGNLDISASLNFTIPLVGSGGFLNERALRTAELAVDSSDLALRNASNNGEINARTQYINLVQLENQIDNNERIFKESLKVFENALQTVQAKAVTNRLDLRDAINQLRTAEQTYAASVLQHYSAKLALATVLGVDQFPGEKEKGDNQWGP